jgi:Tol biopolymer transport system component
LIFDRDRKFGFEVIATVKATRIIPNRTSFRSPWQNGIAMELNKPGKPRSPAPFSSSWEEYGPQFSPDGKKIGFYSSRSGAYFETWTADSDGSNPVQLTFAGVLSGTPRWSPDGRFIAFDSRLGDRSQIFVVDADNGTVRQVAYGDFENSVPNWSRDGEWIYFGSNRSGSWQLWKVPSPGGETIQVTQNRGFFAIESPDGSLTYYAKKIPTVSGRFRQAVGKRNEF